MKVADNIAIIHKLLQSSNTEDINIGIELLSVCNDYTINKVINYYSSKRENKGYFGNVRYSTILNNYPGNRLFEHLMGHFKEVDYVLYKRYVLK